MDASDEKKLRMVIDYRKLNLVIIDDEYPIPHTEDIFDHLGGVKFFYNA